MFILFSGCTSETDVEEVVTLHANLFVRYIYPQQEYKAEVVFKEGDTLSSAQPVTIAGEVQFMDRVLPPNPLDDNLVRYDRRFKSAFEPKMTFLLPNTRGQETPFDLEILPLTELNISPIISRESAFLFSCTPATLTEKEAIILLFNDANNRAASITIEGPADLTQIQLSGNELGQLSPGVGTVYAVKKTDGQERQNDMVVHWSMEYYSDERPVQIQ